MAFVVALYASGALILAILWRWGDILFWYLAPPLLLVVWFAGGIVIGEMVLGMKNEMTRFGTGLVYSTCLFIVAFGGLFMWYMKWYNTHTHSSVP